MTNARYVIVSPAKDEEHYIEHTINSIITQTLKPLLWVIVDDGSTDNTYRIIKHYEQIYPFIKIISNPAIGPRQTGSAVVRAFNIGYEFVKNIEYDFIIKLDCDLSFEPDYFEKLTKKFIIDPNLGIASGIYLEKNIYDGNWYQVLMPTYHAAGACKVIRKNCFERIGGFIESPGWDTVDEIRAMHYGWQTCHFDELIMKHHKQEGSGIGWFKTSMMHGKIFYLTGGNFFFFTLKFLHRIIIKPYFLNAIALFLGYLLSLLKNGRPLVTVEEANVYNQLLYNRLLIYRNKLL